MEGSTACSGYSKAFRYLMTELGIPCYFCYGQGYGGSGGGESETDMLIHGEDCLNEISAAIDNREHMDAYVSDAMEYLGWNGCSFQIQTNIYTVREDEYLFIQHNTLTPSE